jgi:hypothetical protein
MFEILSESAPGCIGFKVSGKISAEDYDELMPVVDKAIEEGGQINMLVLVDDFEGVSEFEAAVKDFNFGTHEYKCVERCAFVSDKNWFKWVVKIMDPFTRRTKEKYFELDQLAEAWDWVKRED